MFLFYHQSVISSQPGNYYHQKLESFIAPLALLNHTFAIALPKAQLDRQGYIAFPVHHAIYNI